jgi:hypothetical protein
VESPLFFDAGEVLISGGRWVNTEIELVVTEELVGEEAVALDELVAVEEEGETARIEKPGLKMLLVVFEAFILRHELETVVCGRLKPRLDGTVQL